MTLAHNVYSQFGEDVLVSKLSHRHNAVQRSVLFSDLLVEDDG